MFYWGFQHFAFPMVAYRQWIISCYPSLFHDVAPVICQKSRAFAGEPVDPTVVPKHCEIVSKSDVLCLLAAATRQMGPSLLRQLRWCVFIGSAQFGKNKRAALRLFCRRSSSQRMCMWYFLDAFPAGHNITNFSGSVDVDIETYDTSKKIGIHSSRLFLFFQQCLIANG